MANPYTSLFCDKCKTTSTIPFVGEKVRGMTVHCWNCRELIHKAVPTLDNVLETILGGPPEGMMLRKDSLKMVVDMTPLLELAGGEWGKVLERVII